MGMAMPNPPALISRTRQAIRSVSWIKTSGMNFPQRVRESHFRSAIPRERDAKVCAPLELEHGVGHLELKVVALGFSLNSSFEEKTDVVDKHGSKNIVGVLRCQSLGQLLVFEIGR